MYLIIAPPTDICACTVAATLQAAGQAVWQISNPMAPPWSLRWQYDAWGVGESELRHEDGTRISGVDIRGVLVLGAPRLDRAAWSEKDYDYVSNETQAGLLAWLYTLAMPLLGWRPAELWFSPDPPLLAWRPLLLQAGLSLADMLISNDAAASRAFAPAVVASALSAPVVYKVDSVVAWAALDGVQAAAPVCLSPLLGERSSAVVVGDTVVWAGPRYATLEANLRKFVTLAGLQFASIAIAASEAGPQVTEVSSSIAFAHLSEVAQSRIITALVRMLLGGGR